LTSLAGLLYHAFMIWKALACAALALAGCYTEVYREPAAVPAGPPLTREEVERLAAAGVSEAVILELVEQRGARPLSADDIVALKKAGASDAVVQKMIARETKQPEVVYVERPVYYRSYYYYDPWWPHSWYCGPGIGFSYHYYWWRPRAGFGVRIVR
jgi:hypothetical protein